MKAEELAQALSGPFAPTEEELQQAAALLRHYAKAIQDAPCSETCLRRMHIVGGYDSEPPEHRNCWKREALGDLEG